MLVVGEPEALDRALHRDPPLGRLMVELRRADEPATVGSGLLRTAPVNGAAMVGNAACSSSVSAGTATRA